jgi:hypothetical protein
MSCRTVLLEVYRVKSIYMRILKPQNLQTICKNHVHSALRHTSALGQKCHVQFKHKS